MTASLLGAIASHYVASSGVTGTANMSLAATAAIARATATGTAGLSLAATGTAVAVLTPATVVTPKQAGKPKSTVISIVSSITAALPQTPTAGNTLIAHVVTNSPSTTPTCSTPAGWTAGPARVSTSGSARLGLFSFWKLATGSEANPAFNFNVSQNGGVVIQEWTGLDTSAPHLADGAGAQVAGNGSLTLTDAITTSTANEWVLTALGVSVTDTLLPITWTLPELPFNAPSRSTSQVTTGATTLAWASGCYPSPGAQAPQAVAAVGAGTSTVTGIVSMSFKIASGTRPQVVESSYTEYTANTGTWTATLVTTPDPTDVLICAIPHLDTLGTVNISGCGATWTLRETHDTVGGYDMHVWTGINATSAGAVTVTSANARPGKIRVLRVSGVGQPVSTTYSRATGLSVTGPSVTAGPGQLVVALQAVNSTGSSDFPITSASPGLANWSTDALLQATASSGAMQDAWSAPSAAGTSHTVTGTTVISSRVWMTAMVVVG